MTVGPSGKRKHANIVEIASFGAGRRIFGAGRVVQARWRFWEQCGTKESYGGSSQVIKNGLNGL
jgi:hypothetical protein